jgi:hypothetical protein
MFMTDIRTPVNPRVARLQKLIDTYLRALSVLLMLMGIFQWAVIIGAASRFGWSFDTLTTEWKLVTMNFAVADLVAAVGLWMRVSWGTVIWFYAAASDILVHSAFPQTFGRNVAVVSFHIVTVLVFLLLLLAKRHVRRL